MRNRLGFVHRCEPAGHGASTRLLPHGTGGKADDLVSLKGAGRRPPVAAGPCSRTTASGVANKSVGSEGCESSHHQLPGLGG